ncbi:helix-turn-helix transcriptional regulator [Spirosoma foliorum]|uniref:Helix-turn-helix transcriptional regulator n=1 Tax=Spirosoma foliorum TaxID=2710596 RepID=A0A7G5GZE1_9BACT|nr:AraC family transcriptional regulator [Spirosoma foliorum]QMW04233.1 helix-turn-helix transcriptional regulator [Spirosoma foliorum]
MFDTIKSLQLSLLHMGFIQLDARWQYDNVISPFSRLYLITAGEGWVFHNRQKFMLKPGHLYLIPRFTYSRYHCDQFLEQYYISFFDELREGLSIYDLKSMAYEVQAEPIDYTLMDRLLAQNPDRAITQSDPKIYDNRPEVLSFNQPQSNQSMSQFVETNGILLQLFSRFLGAENDQDQQRAKGFHQLASILQYIDSHLHDKLTVEKLAHNAHLNADYFSRLFLSIVGIRPMDYIINKRLERAQLLMMTSSMALKTVAESVGIPSIYYFSRLFKRRFGVPPGQYRETAWQM